MFLKKSPPPGELKTRKCFVNSSQLAKASIILCSTLVLGISSCKKAPIADEQTTQSQYQLMSQSASQDIMLPHRKISPYSMKVIHALREMATRTQNAAIINELNAPLKGRNFHLYYRVEAGSQSQLQALNDWVAQDSMHILLSLPIDSISMYPHLYSQTVIDNRCQEKQ